MSNNDTGHLKTNQHEMIKSYITYDGSDRMSVVYEARADAVANTPCMKTTYTYVSTSSRVEKMKEETAVWSLSYDI